MEYTDEELLADLREVAEHIGSTPTQSAFDLLHALKDVESDHRISAECGVRGSNPHSEGTGSIPVKLSFSPSL